MLIVCRDGARSARIMASVPMTVAGNPRRARAGDAAAIADVWLRSRHASVPSIPAPVHTDGEVRAWFAEVVVPTRETWVVEGARGDVVAMMVLDHGWLDQLYVDPAHTGTGLGTQLLDLAKQRNPRG